MTALPPETDITNAASEAAAKTFFTNLRAYLSGVLGAAGDKIYQDQIAEATADAGVTVDGTLLKDGGIVLAAGKTVAPGDGGTGLEAALTTADYGKSLQVNAAGTALELAGPLQGFRNKIINGRFDVWQRGTNFTATNIYTADRWDIGTSAAPTAITVSRQSFSAGQTDVPGEPTYFLRLDKADNAAWPRHKIEDVRTLAGQTATLSFYAKAGAVTTHDVTVNQIFGSGGSATVAATVTLSSANVGTGWAKYTATIELPSISGKTIGTNSYVEINIIPAGGAVIYDLAQVQFEYGLVASPFEQRPPGVELGLCKWYFERRTATVAYRTFACGHVNSGTQARGIIDFATKRTSPTLAFDTASNFRVYAGVSAPAMTAIGSEDVGRESCTILATVASGLTAGNGAHIQANNSTTAYIDIDAEI
ncbi:hypothetical protein [Magnetovibrio sp.]|uniref:hypothetical protein n=1 Tax=Magnetovibrio sp. TaxID=2024836 RepID=UPI002F95950A